MSKIETLTEEQEVLLQNTLNKWLAIGRSCEPLNMNKVNTIIEEFYRRIGKDKPLILKFDSPYSCMIAIDILKNANIKGIQLRDQLKGQLYDQLYDQLRDQLWGQLRNQLRNQLSSQLRNQLYDQLRGQMWDQLSDQLYDQLNDQLKGQLNDRMYDQLRDQLNSQLRGRVRDQVSDQLRDQLYDQLYDHLRDQLYDQLRGQVYDQLCDQLRSQVNWNYFGGSFWCNLEVFYKYCHDIGVTYTSDQLELLDLWLRQSEEMCLWWPTENICVVSERPDIVNIDEAGRLHNPDGPAIRYRDGWSLYAINGVRMPEKYFTEPVTVDVIDQEENTEIRRKLIERYGLQKYVENSNAEKIAEDEWGILYRKDVLNDEPIVMVSVLNSTPEEYEYEGLEERLEKREFRRSELGTPGKYKRYMLRVPPDTKTPLQGLAWMADMTEEEYAMLDCES